MINREKKLGGLSRCQSLTGLALLGISTLISIILYVPLYKNLWRNTQVADFFSHFVLPVALFHLAGFLVLTVLFHVRYLVCISYWAASTFFLLLLGGRQRFVAWILLGIFALLLVEIGRWCAEQIFVVEVCGWGTSLGIGILISSFCGSILASFHLFRWWAIAILLVSAGYILLGHLLHRIRNIGTQWKKLLIRWNWADALGYEGFFLVSVFLFVASTAPEMSSDATRFYWPYIKMLKIDGGFFNIPFQWSYTIPQAGLTYAATIYALWGGVAVRWAMPLVWITLGGILLEFHRIERPTVNLALGLIIGSCPAILWVSAPLMQDTYVCLCVVILALASLKGKKPGSACYWFSLGSLSGMAWTAKYSTFPFMLPLGAFALLRSWKTKSFRFSSLLFAPVGALLIASPWLINTYRESGNPFFPFLQKIWPSPLWPNGSGFGNLGSFRLPEGYFSWLAWPYWMTYQTHRFVEICDGSLGLVLPVLLVLSIFVFFRGSFFSRAMIFSGLIGTALLCSQTAYIRYWSPGLWLAAFGATEVLGSITTSNLAKISVVSMAVIIALGQLPFAMFNNWASPQGWPWDYYVGKLNESQYIERHFQGYHQLAAEKELTSGWPKVWHTGYAATGNLKVRPLEALLWEMSLHGATNPRAKVQYLGSTGCKYWIVDEASEDAMWLWRTGVAPFYWIDDYSILSVGTVNLLRMRTQGEALKAFDERAKLGTNLVWDGELELGESAKTKYWWCRNGADWQKDSSIARSGQGYLRIQKGGECRQDIPLPNGLKKLELVEWIRSGLADQEAKTKFQLVYMGPSEKPLKISSSSVMVTEKWMEFRMTSDVPSTAVWAIIFLRPDDGQGVCLFDSIALRVMG